MDGDRELALSDRVTVSSSGLPVESRGVPVETAIRLTHSVEGWMMESAWGWRIGCRADDMVIGLGRIMNFMLDHPDKCGGQNENWQRPSGFGAI